LTAERPQPPGREAPPRWPRPRRRDSIKLAPWAPALVLLPLLVLAVGTYFNGTLLWHEKVDPRALPQLASCLSHRYEAIGRTRLLAAFLPYMLVSILIFLYFVREFLWLLGPRARRRLALPIILFLILAVSITALQMLEWRDPLGALGAGFYEAVFERLAACRPGEGPILFTAGEEVQPLFILRYLTIAFSILLTLAAGSVIVGTISTVGAPARSLPARARAYYRTMQRERLDRYLYASALLLVFGLFVMDSALRWPAEFAEDKKIYSEHVNALMLYNGIFYSTILAAYFVPAALWQRARYARRRTARDSAARMADAPPDEASLADKLSPSRLMKTILALLSPAIAGVLTQLLEGLGS
jgi:hypothetical protein